MRSFLSRLSPIALLLLMAAVSCVPGTPPKLRCDATACTGCCDQNDVCQPGVDGLACGVGGTACTACDATQVCQLGACVGISASGGGGGSDGSGGGGGATDAGGCRPVCDRAVACSLVEAGLATPCVEGCASAVAQYGSAGEAVASWCASCLSSHTCSDIASGGCGPACPDALFGGTSHADGGDGGVGLRVFETATTYPADLKTAGGGASGLHGADRLCQLAAAAANLGGTWKAWLSDATVDAIDRISGAGPWHLVGTGEVVFNNRLNLTTSPAVAIDHTEHGTLLYGQGVWTGTESGGRKTGSTPSCSNWTSSSVSGGGLSGWATSISTWTSWGISECYEGHRLYCFEQ